MVDLTFTIADLVPDTDRPVDTRTPEQVAADKARGQAILERWEREAKAADAARAHRAEQEASGERRPIRPWPRPAGMDATEWRLLVTARAEHSEWAHEHGGVHGLQSGEYLEPLLATGWPWYPQSLFGKRRLPLLNKVVPGTGVLEHGPFPEDTQRDLVYRLKRHPEGDRNNRRPERRTFEWQGQWLHSTAVALYLGYRGMWFLDMDVERPEWCATVQRLAVEHLGATPFRRGRHDSRKCAWGYRMAEGERMPRNTALRLLTGETRITDKDVEVAVSEDVEFKSTGQSITILGQHHTRVPYCWEDRIPALDGSTPDDLPEVTAAQVDAFIAAMEAEFADVLPKRAARSASRELVLTEAGEHGELATVATAEEDPDPRRRWVVHDGKVVDGREAWSYHHCITLMRANAARLLEIVDTHGVGAAQGTILGQFKRDLPNLAADGGEHSHAVLADDVENGKLARAWDNSWPGIAKRAPRIERRDDGTSVLVEEAAPSAEPTTPAEAKESGDEDLAGLLHGCRPKPIKGIARSAPDPAKAAVRARPTDRRPIEEHVARVLTAGISDFFRRAAAERTLCMILKLPTGAGKTSRLIGFIADLVAAGEVTKPIGILMPSHGLIEAQAERVQTEAERIAGGRAMAAGFGLRAMTYKGRFLHCHPKHKPKMAALQAKGIGVSGMCSSKDKDGKPIFCDKFAGCGATLQKAQIANSHIVFLPSAYLTAKLPKELSEGLHCIIVDEACHDQLIGVSHVTPSTLRLGRKQPRLKAGEVAEARESGERFEDVAHRLMDDRDTIAGLVLRAIAEGHHDAIPEYLARVPRSELPEGLTVRHLAVTARRVCADATLADVSPLTTLTGAQAIGTGTEVWPEWHLWDVIVERLDAIMLRRLHDEVASYGVDPGPLPRGAARGPRDMRLQTLHLGTREDGSRYVTDETRIRVSFRRTPNWANVPVLLMDASADADVTAKLWPGRRPEVVQVRPEDARPHLRVLWLPESVRSDRSLLPYKPEAVEEAAQSAASLAAVRALAEGLCAYYAKGRVLFTSTMAVRIATLAAWAGPANLDSGHHGALVGLDWFKAHSALVVVGRNEPPVSAVDAMAGALTYDDDEPELPFDLRGDGKTDEIVNGKRLDLHYPEEERTVAMADGSDVTYGVPTHPGRWGRKLQWLAREEQNGQAIGRLRPVYKDGEALAPLVVIAGRSLPEGTVVDAISTLADVNGALGKLRRLRRDDLGFAPDLQSIGCMTEPTPTRAALTVKGWPAIRYRALDAWSYVDSTGKPRTGRVLGNDADPQARIAAYEDAAGRGAPRDMRLVEAGMPSTAATARPADLKMEALVGTRADRARLAEALAGKAQAKADAFKKAAGRGGYARDFDVEAAMAWVANPWRPRGEYHLRDLEHLDAEAHAAALAEMVIEGECVEPEDVAPAAPRTLADDLADMEAAGVDVADTLLAA